MSRRDPPTAMDPEVSGAPQDPPCVGPYYQRQQQRQSESLDISARKALSFPNRIDGHGLCRDEVAGEDDRSETFYDSREEEAPPPVGATTPPGTNSTHFAYFHGKRAKGGLRAKQENHRTDRLEKIVTNMRSGSSSMKNSKSLTSRTDSMTSPGDGGYDEAGDTGKANGMVPTTLQAVPKLSVAGDRAHSFVQRVGQPLLMPSRTTRADRGPKSWEGMGYIENSHGCVSDSYDVLQHTMESLEVLALYAAPVRSTQSIETAPTKAGFIGSSDFAEGWRSLQPIDLLRVEKGRAIVLVRSLEVVPLPPSGDTNAQYLQIATGRHVLNLSKVGNYSCDAVTVALPVINNEVGLLGGAWRGTLRRLLVATLDPINALRMSRALQFSLPYLTGYESFVMSQVVEALDSADHSRVAAILKVAMLNRNVSRLIVQASRPRHDFCWHWSTAVRWNRVFDAWGRMPLLGITGFPATENFPSTRNHALASIFRVVLGEGNWITRVVTRGRQGLVTDNPNTTAQNLAAESIGFEVANRNQYGTYFGREKTNEFRAALRLPVDESLLRTFITQPMATTVNNGVVHMLRHLAKHWNNMLYQEWGNFAHQRMEQLDPFETLRFHMPEVLLIMSSLRGRNRWDAEVLGPMMEKLHNLEPSSTSDNARQLIRELREEIVVDVCGGISAMIDPFYSWLEAMDKACLGIEKVAREVYELVSSVELGIRLGYDVMTQITCKVPSDTHLKDCILKYIGGEPTSFDRRIRSAFELTTPRDKRTLMDLVLMNLTQTRPAQLLLSRVKTLLQRELRREKLNQKLIQLSKGDYLTERDLSINEWYWVEDAGRAGVHRFIRKRSDPEQFVFVHVDSGVERVLPLKGSTMKVRRYVPIAEAITRAQKMFMTIELEHGRTYKYNALMEFNFLRVALRRLVVISQMACEVLDKARLNILGEVQRSSQTQLQPNELLPGQTYYILDPTTQSYRPFLCRRKYYRGDDEFDTLMRKRIVALPPQSVLVVGGGPTGLMAAIHCAENCLASGGIMKLYEARDAFAKGGNAFERAQIVRLDSRWVAMLRYHLGTGFEDVFIPASGETDSQLGNTLPLQGFIEITIKDMENLLHIEVSKLWSRGLISVFTDSRAQFDPSTNSLVKFGRNLKVGDLILRHVDSEGRVCRGLHSWRVVELASTKSLGIDDLKVGGVYGVYIRQEQAVLPFKLVAVDLNSRMYSLESLVPNVDNLCVSAHNLPSLYPAGSDSRAHADVKEMVVESVEVNRVGAFAQDRLVMKAIAGDKFTLDVGHTHVFEAIGKPHDSKVHFLFTNLEPHAVCCMQGLKVSFGMHNFGETRWGRGLLDDIRSLNDRNTRIIGDFTKMVRAAPIVHRMERTLRSDSNWALYFERIVADSRFPELNELAPVFPKLVKACAEFAAYAPQFRRPMLQTRFFETGDNFYLGMDLLREYDDWKRALVRSMVGPITQKSSTHHHEELQDELMSALAHGIDRLWYDSCLETIRTGDVYNPGARHRVPRLYLTNSYKSTDVTALPVGESFRLNSDPGERYEILLKTHSMVTARTVEGYLHHFKKGILVNREGNLTRAPDGNHESKVAISTFQVGHYVNFRCMRLSDKEKGYVFAFGGDEQATPHFMRYSGLTGACINVMSFNNFIQAAMDGAPLVERYRKYCQETNWSNGEVVQRGTNSNFGHAFLRPGFTYCSLIEYLFSKIAEHIESEQNLDEVLSRDWKVKVGASLIPRGLEMDGDFIAALRQQFRKAVLIQLSSESMPDDTNPPHDFKSTENGNGSDWPTKDAKAKHSLIAKIMNQVCDQIIDHVQKGYIYNERLVSELFNQPKPVDSIVDDFAVEAQNFANALAMSAAFGSGALAFRLVAASRATAMSSFLGAINILISFGTMTNVARYKIRNEEARILFMDKKFDQVQKSVFALLGREAREKLPWELNPFATALDKSLHHFVKTVRHYDCHLPPDFIQAYDAVRASINDIHVVGSFRKLIATHYMVDIFHENSYVQEALVRVYKGLYELQSILARTDDFASGSDTLELFYQLACFKPLLELSLQRGPVLWGFIKQRKFKHWDIMIALRYLYSLLWFCGSTSGAPIQVETRVILRRLRDISAAHGDQVLCREIRDMDALFWATRESDNSSLIFIVAFLSFVASFVFTLGRAFGIGILNNFAFYATAVTALGAILATSHFIRKIVILMGLWVVLGSKFQTAASPGDRSGIAQVRKVTAIQITLTLLRLLSAGTATVALPFAVAQNGFGNVISTDPLLPLHLALVSLSFAVLATIFFFYVEYIVRYNLSTQLGPLVGELFRDEIESMYKAMSVLPMNDIDTKQVQERETWEYTAREFLHKWRFDTVFAADRFGMILQYIQGGMDRRTPSLQ